METQQFFTQSVVSSQLSRRVSFMIPFQLSPVATLKSVRKAMPKFAKCACSPRPWQGNSSLHSETHFSSVPYLRSPKKKKLSRQDLTQSPEELDSEGSEYEKQEKEEEAEVADLR